MVLKEPLYFDKRLNLIQRLAVECYPVGLQKFLLLFLIDYVYFIGHPLLQPLNRLNFEYLDLECLIFY